MRFLLPCICILAFFTSSASAQTLSFLSENRRVQLRNFMGGFDDVISADGFDNFSVSLNQGSISQESSLNFNSLVFQGGLDGGSVSQDTDVNSVFEVVFNLSEPAEYTLDLTIEDISEANVQFLGPSLAIDEIRGPIFDPFIISQSGTLDAGTYNVLVDISTQGFFPFEGTYDLNLQIATVPEPSSIAILGLAGIAGIVRRRR